MEVNFATRLRPRPADAPVTMLGLAGFAVTAAVDLGDELELMVRSERVEEFCRSWGAQTVLPDRRPPGVWELPAGGRPVRLCWWKGVWRWVSRGLDGSRCAPLTWPETS